jgi:hypothetical protein
VSQKRLTAGNQQLKFKETNKRTLPVKRIELRRNEHELEKNYKVIVKSTDQSNFIKESIHYTLSQDSSSNNTSKILGHIITTSPP